LSKDQANVVRRLADREFDFWSDPSIGRSADIMASPGNFKEEVKVNPAE